MMRSRAVAWGLCFVGLAAQGCTRPRTEIVVTVRSDFDPGSLRALTVTVRRNGPTGALLKDESEALGGGAAQWQLPLAFGLVAADPDALTPVWVEVLGCATAARCNRNDAVVAQRAVVSFRAGETLGLEMLLAASCRGVACTEVERCVPNARRCEAAERAGADLRPFSGNAVPPTDAAFFDGAVDLPAVTDAPADATLDAPAVPDVPDAGDVIDASDVNDVGDTPVAVDALDASDVSDAARCDGGPCAPSQRSCADPATPGCGVVLLAGGTFALGAATECATASSATCAVGASPPVRDVTVSPFAFDAHEVTVARFRAYWSVRGADIAAVRARPIAYPNGTAIAWGAASREPTVGTAMYNWSTSAAMREAHPINGVDWWTAQEFCVWDGGRLPTEAEWEFAARWRAVSEPGAAVGRLYPWGDTEPTVMCDRARWVGFNCMGDDGAATRRVGSFAATGGLYDLAGNVAELTADRFTAYGVAPCWGAAALRDPLCAMGSATITVRGGSYLDDVTLQRSASRAQSADMTASPRVGFRCARAAP